uniref:Uncharacterized protein n=1 Tax=Plasmodiophora brassicae TaxID=37360 RepID=A8Y7Q7_PLABS
MMRIALWAIAYLAWQGHAYVQTEHVFPDQLVDHTAIGGGGARFSQRYFRIDQFWSGPDGPVILQLCGEYTCAGVTDGRQFPSALAERYGALVLVLEHRYFGKSSPFSVLSPRNLTYLTTFQALSDIACFTDWYQRVHIGRANANKWITIGGSYPGALAAWYRLKYPHLTAGALASSAVVAPFAEFPEFDEQVALSAGPECTHALQDITAMVEGALQEGGRLADEMNALFSCSQLSDADFLYLIADAMAEAIQYGPSVSLCDPIVQAESRDDRLAAFVEFVQGTFYASMSNSPGDYDGDTMASHRWVPDSSGRQWWWMKCNEVGWFQIAPGTNSIRSKRVNMEWHRDRCEKLFGDVLAFPPPCHRASIEYSGFDMSVSNVVFTNGVEDPWQWAGASAFSSSAHLRDSSVLLINCSQCGHCVDLHTPSPDDAPALTTARSTIIAHIDRWLIGSALQVDLGSSAVPKAIL